MLRLRDRTFALCNRPRKGTTQPKITGETFKDAAQRPPGNNLRRGWRRIATKFPGRYALSFHFQTRSA
jgi:hypothetical protein